MAANTLRDTLFDGVVAFTNTSTIALPDSTVDNDAVSATAAIARSKLAQDALAEYVIGLETLRVHDAISSLLPTAAAADDLGCVTGTFGTSSPTVTAGDVKTTSSTRRARFLFKLPPEYDTGETVTVRIRAEMVTTIADGSCTVDVECYEHDEDGLVGADICTTAATTMNSLTIADKDFTVTPTTLQAGDELDIRISIAYVDAATGTAVTPTITKVSVLLDIKG